MGDRVVTMMGGKVTLLGNDINIGDDIPDVILLDKSRNEVSLRSLRGKKKVIFCSPFLDTPVCSLQLKHVESMAAALSEDSMAVHITADVPEKIQALFERDNSRFIVLSDCSGRDYGMNTGFLIEGMNVLTRAALVVNSSNVVQDIYYSAELMDELDHGDIFHRLEQVD